MGVCHHTALTIIKVNGGNTFFHHLLFTLFYSPLSQQRRDGRASNQRLERSTNLLEWIAELSENAVLIKHLALEPLLIVIVDPLPHISRQLVERHVLLHLLILKHLCETHGDLTSATAEIPLGQCHHHGSIVVTLCAMCSQNDSEA